MCGRWLDHPARWCFTAVSLSRNVKTNRGFHHPVTGSLLCPASLDWNNSGWVLTLAVQEAFFFVIIFCSTHEGLKNNEITVAGDQWPLLIYADCMYDPAEPWEGLFRNKLLIWVLFFTCLQYSVHWHTDNLKAFKHIFTSPSSVDVNAKATRSRNACIHGMTQVTTASLAYVATQVCT